MQRRQFLGRAAQGIAALTLGGHGALVAAASQRGDATVRVFDDHRRLLLSREASLAIAEFGRATLLLQGTTWTRQLGVPDDTQTQRWQRRVVAARRAEDGHLWLLDGGNRRFEIYRADARHLRNLALPEATISPSSFDFDGAGGVWLSDSMQATLLNLDGEGGLRMLIDRQGLMAGQLNGPRAVFRDSRGRLHVLNAGNRRVDVLNAQGRALFSYADSTAGAAPRALVVVDDGSWLLDAEGRHLLGFDHHGRPMGARPLPGAGAARGCALNCASSAAGAGLYLSI